VFVNCIDLDSFSGVLETVVQGDIKPGWWDTFQLRNLINRRNVVMKVKTDMNATEDFLRWLLQGTSLLSPSMHVA